MELTERDRNAVMAQLGQGYSVAVLCANLGISYDELCKLAERYGSLKHELKRWYPKYDFEVKEVKHEVSKRKQAVRKP